MVGTCRCEGRCEAAVPRAFGTRFADSRWPSTRPVLRAPAAGRNGRSPGSHGRAHRESARVQALRAAREAAGGAETRWRPPGFPRRAGGVAPDRPLDACLAPGVELEVRWGQTRLKARVLEVQAARARVLSSRLASRGPFAAVFLFFLCFEFYVFCFAVCLLGVATRRRCSSFISTVPSYVRKVWIGVAMVSV